ncbi:hypothetical protein U0070_025708 [Myodes glareolus]|uniref:Uncharacterized protein n=1 Tax=Myodes glareolus TaxID=447135 RepID=A0AAW0HKA2_MYOGA
MKKLISAGPFSSVCKILTFEYFRQQQHQHQQEIDRPRQLSYPCERPTTSSGGLGNSQAGDAASEEDMLRAAVTMSLETAKDNLKAERKK